jgi:5-methylcytosine-specific restriction endonuclease McrA
MKNWTKTRARILARDSGCSGRFLGGPCSPILDVHHILPREEGGTDADDNLIVVCHRHHPQLEALRRQVLLARGWRTCPHAHRSHEARRRCERRLNLRLAA